MPDPLSSDFAVLLALLALLALLLSWALETALDSSFDFCDTPARLSGTVIFPIFPKKNVNLALGGTMAAKLLTNSWNRLLEARLLLFAACIGATLLASGCTPFANRSGDSKSGGWFTPEPPDPPESVEEFMRLKRLDP